MLARWKLGANDDGGALGATGLPSGSRCAVLRPTPMGGPHPSPLAVRQRSPPVVTDNSRRGHGAHHCSRGTPAAQVPLRSFMAVHAWLLRRRQHISAGLPSHWDELWRLAHHATRASTPWSCGAESKMELAATQIEAYPWCWWLQGRLIWCNRRSSSSCGQWITWRLSVCMFICCTVTRK